MSNTLNIDITNKHIVLKEAVLSDAYKDITWRVWLAEGGFGCKPYTSGSAVFCTCVRDGETARFQGFQVERLATDEEVATAAASHRIIHPDKDQS